MSLQMPLDLMAVFLLSVSWFTQKNSDSFAHSSNSIVDCAGFSYNGISDCRWWLPTQGSTSEVNIFAPKYDPFYVI